MFWILFAVLAALGAFLRFGLNHFHHSFTSASPIPLGTLSANAIGSLLMGGLYALQMSSKINMPALVTAVMIAFLGSLTTFSSFAADTLRLLQAGLYVLAAANILLNNFICLSLCYVGFRLVQS